MCSDRDAVTGGGGAEDVLEFCVELFNSRNAIFLGEGVVEIGGGFVLRGFVLRVHDATLSIGVTTSDMLVFP